MPRGPEKSSEFKSYRQALAAIYAATIGIGFLLLAASVVVGLFVRPDAQLHSPLLSGQVSPSLGDVEPVTSGSSTHGLEPLAEQSTPQHTSRQCLDDVVALQRELSERVLREIEAPIRDPFHWDRRDWARFSQHWLARWDRVGAECRFSESTDVGIDIVANVHGDLFAIYLKYQSLLTQFERELTPDLLTTQQALRQARKVLHGKPSPDGSTDASPDFSGDASGDKSADGLGHTRKDLSRGSSTQGTNRGGAP